MQEKIIDLLNEYKALEIDKAVDFLKFNDYLISHHSTCIEGSTLTYVETTVLLEDGLTPKGKPLVHALMQVDHHKALTFVLEKAHLKNIYRPEFIKQINAKVMHSTGQIYYTPLGEVNGTQGEYRKGTVFAGQTTFVNFSKIEALVEQLCQEIQAHLVQVEQAAQTGQKISIIDQLIFSFKMHFDLVYIHPFYDGNGRTSRLLMNALQKYHHLPLAIIFSEDKVDYIQSLMDAKKKEDVNIFVAFMFAQYHKHLSTILAAAKK